MIEASYIKLMHLESDESGRRVPSSERGKRPISFNSKNPPGVRLLLRSKTIFWTKFDDLLECILGVVLPVADGRVHHPAMNVVEWSRPNPLLLEVIDLKSNVGRYT